MWSTRVSGAAAFALTMGAVLGIACSAEQSHFNDLVTAGGRTVAVGGFQENSGVIADSTDLTHWRTQPAPDGQGLWAVCYGQERFLSVGNAGVVVESSDGVTWRMATQIPAEHWLFDIICAPSGFVAGGVSGLYLSEDGEHWLRTDQDSNVYGLIYGGGRYVGVGYEGRIFTSPDARRWTRHDSGTRFMLRSVAYGNGVYVAVGGEGRHGMVVSYDGETWFPSSSGSKAQLMDVVFANGVFMLVGAVWDHDSRTFTDGTIEYSVDGKNWVTYFVPGIGLLNAVASRGAGWILCGEEGYIGQVERNGSGLQLTDLLGGVSAGSKSADSPVLPRLAITPDESGVTLSWQSSLGFNYRVRRSTDLRTWEDVGVSYSGTGERMEHHESYLPGEKAMFFRLEIRAE